MGIYTDLLANAKTINGSDPTVFGDNRAVVREIESLLSVQGDLAYPDGFDLTNEVQSIAVHVAGTGGTYTLTITLNDGTAFTTAALAYDAVNTTVQTAINTAAGAALGDNEIVVAGGPLSTSPFTLTFSGPTVDGLNAGLTVITGGTLLRAAGTAGAATTTLAGTTGVDEIQSIAAHVAATGGTYVLTVLGNPTAAIAYDANAATVQTAVDLVSGVTAGHVAITGGPLTTTPLTITFSGDDVDETNQAQTTINDALLTIAGTPGAVSTVASGGSKRSALAVLVQTGVLTNSLPDQGTDGTFTAAAYEGSPHPNRPSVSLIRALAREVAAVDGNVNVELGILAALGIPA